MINKIKKIFVFLSIFILLGTSIISADAFIFQSSDKTSLKDLINKWNEIRDKKDELHYLLESYGVDLPDLTDEQKWIIWSTVWKMKINGATKDKIRNQVKLLLKSYGVELPNLSEQDKKDIKLWIKNLLENEYGFVFVELTDEQKKEIKQEIIILKEQGLNHEQIKIEIRELLQDEYGFVLPELSDVEKEEIRTKIKNMLETEYGLDLPDLTVEQRDTVKQKRKEIKILQLELGKMLKNTDKKTKLQFYLYVKKTMNPPKRNEIIYSKPIFRIIDNMLGKIKNILF